MTLPTKSVRFRPAFDGVRWTDANPPVRIARWVALGALTPFVVEFVATLASHGGAGPHAPVAVLLVACAIALTSVTVSIVLGVMGIRLARRGAGALRFAVQVLVASSVVWVALLVWEITT